jgi:hypothetical protein
MMIMLHQWDLNEQIKKIGKIVSLYQQEMFKKIPRLGTFCTQPVNEGLIVMCCLEGKLYMPL